MTDEERDHRVVEEMGALGEEYYTTFADWAEKGVVRFLADLDQLTLTGEMPALGEALRDLPVFSRRVYGQLFLHWQKSTTSRVTAAMRTMDPAPSTEHTAELEVQHMIRELEQLSEKTTRRWTLIICSQAIVMAAILVGVYLYAS